MSKVSLDLLTPEQKRDLMDSLRAEEKAQKERTREDRETYKKLVDETVLSLFGELNEISTLISERKAMVFKSFETILGMKAKIYGVEPNQQSHTFSTSDGGVSIRIGHRVNESYDDTVNEGVEKVRKFIHTMAKDENSASLVDTVMSLLKKDAKGNLRASRVIELEKLADKTNDADFIDGIRIIKDSFRPQKTCQYVEARFKNDKGMEVSLPLSFSAAD